MEMGICNGEVLEDGSLRVMVSGKRSRALTNSDFCCKRRIERTRGTQTRVCCWSYEEARL